MKRIFCGTASSENISKITEQAKREMEKILREEENVTEITCKIEILPKEPMRYEIDYSTLQDIRAIN